MAIIVSYGGGVNSTAMLVLMIRHKLPKPDAILFADTGGEKRETYQYIDYFSKWLVDHGMPEIITVKYKTKEGIELTLEQDVLDNKSLPSIAFGFKTCSQKFKIRPQEKWIDEHFPDRLITHYIGFDAGEKRRMKENPIEGHINYYPLIEFDWDRQRCIDEIEKAGLRIPPKSSCFFCPNSKRHEILTLDREYKERAMAMEANAEGLTKVVGLGRHFSWTNLINGDDSQLDLFKEKSFKELTGEEYYPIPCECID